VLTIHLAKRKRDPQTFDMDKLVAASQGYSGAEIEAAVQASLYASFTDQKPLSTQTILEALEDSVPLSVTCEEDIAALRAWAKERAVPASLAESAAAGK
jgi:SpoVK/Ycf46/Vps4 family AAA+-type ATPase